MGSFLFPFFFFFLFAVFVQSQSTSFFFEGFNGAANNLTLELEASIMNNPRGVLRVTKKSNKVIGGAFYNKPIQMIDKASSPNASQINQNQLIFMSGTRITKKTSRWRALDQSKLGLNMMVYKKLSM